MQSAIVCAFNASSTVKLYVGDLDEHRHGDPKWLPPDELQTARRIAVGKAQSRYVCGRLFIREVIAREMGVLRFVEPFRLGPFGKPYLVPASASLRFNISHTGKWIVCAISRCGDVGVDIERAGRNVPAFALDKLFCVSELKEIEASPDRLALELIAWTRKEAALKCLGLGLNIDVRTVKIPIALDMDSVWVKYDGKGNIPDGSIQFNAIFFRDDFVGTVAEFWPKAA